MPSNQWSTGAGPPGDAGAGEGKARKRQARVPAPNRRDSPSAHLRRIALVAATTALLPPFVSFISMAFAGTSTRFSIRAVEWLRNNGAAGLVTGVERIYYSFTAPSKGGPQLRRLPAVGIAGATPVESAGGGELPPDIASLAGKPLPGEGVWLPTRRGAGGNPALLVTSFRSEPAEYPRNVAGLAWIDTKRTNIVLYAGQSEPSVEMLERGPAEVPPALRGRLLATFNSGFKLADSHGGFALGGHVYAPLLRGQATFVKYRNGSYDITAWRGSRRSAPEVQFARQNLPLIVEQGRPSPRLSDGNEWGVTLGNSVRVWRSGIGIDSHGNLVYAAANDQTARSLAQILIHAGAIRAMQLDINSYWVSFNSYGAPGAGAAQKLLSGIERPANRYLEPDERDFFAVYGM